MSRYPVNTDIIHHNPRPTTDLIEKANSSLTIMSTSPGLLPQTELEPLPNTYPLVSPNSSDEAVEYPQLVMFGDSITQFSTLTLQAYLQTQYIRRLDIINRGLSGFNAPMGYRALQRFLPVTPRRLDWPLVKIVTVFFGANDACVPGEYQHVDLQHYVDTIKDIIHYPVFQQDGSRKTEIIIITPPPVNEHQFRKTHNGHFQRRAGVSSQYARAAAEASKQYGVHVVDLWSILMQKVGWTADMGRDCCSKHIPCHFDSKDAPLPPDETTHIPGCAHLPASSPEVDYQLSDFLTDGLHLTKLGYDVLFWELLKLIKTDIPQCAPESLPFMLPEWRDFLQMPISDP